MQVMNRERQEPPEQELPDDDFKDEEDILPPPEAGLDLGEAAPSALKAGSRWWN